MSVKLSSNTWRISRTCIWLKARWNASVAVKSRILKFLHARVAKLGDPRSIGEALHGSRLGEFWKYRVGNFRLIWKIEDDRLVVLFLRIGDRQESYR